MVIYIAGRVTARERLKPLRAILRGQGHYVSSTWLDLAMDYPMALTQNGEWDRDLEEIDASEAIILDTIDETPTGGREFEAGYAVAKGKYFVVVGPLRNIFHNKARERYDSWEEVLTNFGKR